MDFSDDELEALYRRYAHVLYHRCERILRDPTEADDAVQETFARVIRHADTFRAQASPLTWMVQIATNHCLNQLRNRNSRRRKLEAHGDDVVASSVAAPLGAPDLAADHGRLLALLDGVDDETRACVIHTYFDDCTRQETAALVGISVPTVRKRVNAFLEVARRAFAAIGLFALPTLWSWP